MILIAGLYVYPLRLYCNITMVFCLKPSLTLEVRRYRKTRLQLQFVRRLNKRISFNIRYKIHNLFTMLQ